MPDKLFNKNFLLMLQGSFVSRLGDAIYSIAIGYYVYKLTGSEFMMGLFTSITMFVNMFLSPITGAFADKLDRKKVIILMDALRGIMMLIIGVLCISERLQTNTLLVFTAFIALASAVFNPSSGTILLDIVPKHEFIRAKSLTSMSMTIVDLIGKSFSGFLLVYFGIGELIVFNGISFIFSAFSECFVEIPRTPKQGSKISVNEIISDLGVGFKAILNTPGLNSIFFSAIFINLLTSGIGSLFLVFTTEKSFSIEQYGILLSFISLGAFLGSLLISLVKIKVNYRPNILTFSLIIANIFVILGLISNNFYSVTLFFLIGQLANAIGSTILNASLMLAIPNDKRATVLGFIMSSIIGGAALSTIVYGILAEYMQFTVISIIGTSISTLPILLLTLEKGTRQSIIKCSIN